MIVGRFQNTATLLTDGRVLVAGGDPNGTSAEIFNPSPLLVAVLPTSRSVQVGTPATAFATIINTGTSTATGCQIAPAHDPVRQFRLSDHESRHQRGNRDREHARGHPGQRGADVRVRLDPDRRDSCH
jgi:hypothetical protein